MIDPSAVSEDEVNRTPTPVGERPHVVIVGAGFGGLACAQALGGSTVRVTVVDRQNYHLFVPLLYQVATTALAPADIAEPIRRVLNRYHNVDVVLGEVAAVDAGQRRVKLADGGFLPYDRLVLATGSTQNYFGHEQWADVAPALKTIEDARIVRTRLLMAFEQAEICPDEVQRVRLMTTVIVGGGPTGVELAGAVAELARFTLARDFRRIDPRMARIVLIEAGQRLLPTFPEALSDYARGELQRLGITILLGQGVERIGADGVTVGGQEIPAGTVIWAAGVRASPAARWLQVEADRAGRIRVDNDLSVPACAGVYALGDTALFLDRNGQALPGLAQVAKQQGNHLGQALAASLLHGTPMPPFRYRDRGNAAIIGRSAAVFDFGRRRLKGWLAWLLWAVVHVYLLVGVENRLAVSLKWLWRYLTYESGSRLIADAKPGALDQTDRCHPGR
ncbi:MAG: NAD(P)/FAD-dependent oxidoreductase [Actinomycetota bacterium]